MQVLEERGNLHMAWQQKKIYIEQLLDLQYFLRDTKQITAFMTAQERAATRTINVEDIETIDKVNHPSTRGWGSKFATGQKSHY